MTTFIVQDTAGQLYHVVDSADPDLAHVWLGYQLKRSKKTASGYAPKAPNAEPRIIRKAGCIVLKEAV